MLSTFFLTSDFAKSAGNNTALAAIHTLQGMAHLEKIHDLTTAVNIIDDRIDSSPPDWILNAGHPRLGTTPSPIFLSEATCPREFTYAFNEVVRIGLTPHDVGIAFNNILATGSYERAICVANFRENPSVENRKALHEANIRITEAYSIFIFRCLTKAISTPDHLDTLSHKDVVKYMPEVAQISAILQIFDDMRDILIDMEVEVLDGIPTSNWITLKMAENGDLTKGTDEEKSVKDYVRERSQYCEEDKNPPSFLRRAFDKTEIEVSKKIADVSSVAARGILYASLDTFLNSGLKSSFHHDMIFKDEKRKAEKAQLAIKCASNRNCHIGQF